MKRSAAASREKQSSGDKPEQLVAERTAELSATIELLRKELADLKRAAQQFHEGELSFQLIVESIPVPVAVTSPSGEVEALNQATIAMQQRAHETGSAYNVESRHRRADGIYRWFNVRGFPLRDTEGHILRWFHLLVDIDDRKRAEEALRRSETDLKLIVDTIPALAWSARPDGSAEFFNQHYLDYLGLSAEEARDRWWTVAVHPDDREELQITWQRIMASEELGEGEARLRRHDGQYRWFLFRANPVRDESGKLVKWYGI